MWGEIIKFLIGASGISVLAGFFGKKLLDFLSKAGIEKYKAELREAEINRKHELNKQIESHKNQLEKLNLEYQIKQSVFQQELLGIIRKTYELLIKFEQPLEYMFRPIKINPDKSQDELANEVIDAVNNFISYTVENDVVYTESVSKIIDSIRSCIHRIWQPYDMKKFMGQLVSGDMRAKIGEDMNNAYKEILQKEMQELKVELKKEFRSQIGVQETEYSFVAKLEK